MVKLMFNGCAHANFLSHDNRPSTRVAAKRPPCTQAVLAVNFAWARQFSVNFTTTTAWLQGFPPLLPLKTIVLDRDA